MRNCDIIIPVINKNNYLNKCIESIISYTNLENNRLLIIDDVNCDDNTFKYINSLSDKYNRRLIYIRNKEKLGINKSINIGIEYSDNDIFLLRDDTEVMENWLEKIKISAYSKENIATVTSLTNIYQFASMYKNNELNKQFDNFDLSKYRYLIKDISYKENNEIPVCKNFCIYIKREVIKTIGLFYENEYIGIEDFCYRCLDYGYRHILNDEVYLHHNITEENYYFNKNLFEENEKYLNENYSVNKKNSDLWFRNKTLKYISKNLNYNSCLRNGNNNILIIIHEWDKEVNGGTSFHVLDLKKGLGEKYNFHILAPYNGTYRLYSYWRTGEELIDINTDNLNSYSNSLFDSRYAKMINNIINIFKIDFIHIHHLLGHYFDIIDIIKERKIKTIISLHDYYSLCPRVNKYNYIYNKYCNTIDENECAFCLKYFSDKIKNIIAWKNIWNILFLNVDKIIVPSKSVKIKIENIHKNISINVIEHGIDITKINEELNIDNKNEFHIAFIGVLIRIKGEMVVEELVKFANKKSKKIYFHFFGYSELDNLRKYKFKNYKYHGKYKRDELGKLLKENNIMLTCIFSIVPETFSYTLTESVANNIPVLGIDIGAVGQRIKDNNLGWLIKYGSSTEEIYQNIINIISNKDEYKKIAISVSEYKIKNVNEMCNEYNKIYSEFKYNNKENDISEIKLFIKNNYQYSLDKHLKKIKANENSLEINKIKQIYKSNSWRIGRFITWIPRKIKKIIQCLHIYGIKNTIKIVIAKFNKKKYK